MAMIAVGVCGGIGAYKSVEVVRGLQKQGHDVVAVMTRSAKRFVGELTFEAITRHRVLTSQFEPGANSDIEHISLASSIDLLLDRAGNGEHHRQICQRHRRRFPDVAVPRDQGSRSDRSSHEHEHARARGRAEKPRRAGSPRNVFRRPGRRLSGMRLDWQGTPGGAGGHRACGGGTAHTFRAARWENRPRHRGAHARGAGSGALRRQPVERKNGLRHGGCRPRAWRAGRAGQRTDRADAASRH